MPRPSSISRGGRFLGQQPRTLTDNEVYALTAYILALNKIIGENDAMNAETLPQVKMPNRDGFISKYPEKH
jgi:hypothetical protein